MLRLWYLLELCFNFIKLVCLLKYKINLNYYVKVYM